MKDMVDMMKILSTKKRNFLDDGTVVGHENLDESVTEIEKSD